MGKIAILIILKGIIVTIIINVIKSIIIRCKEFIKEAELWNYSSYWSTCAIKCGYRHSENHWIFNKIKGVYFETRGSESRNR